MSFCYENSSGKKPGVPPEGLLNKLRLFIKLNSYGQYVALLLMSIVAIYSLLFMDLINKGSVVCSTVLRYDKIDKR